MFSTNHIILLVVCAVLVAIGVTISVKLKVSSRKASLIFFIICCASEIVKDSSNIIPSNFGGFVLDPFDIPLHLCSIVIFAMLYIVITKNNQGREHIKTAVTVIGLVAPVLALLIPAEGVSFNKTITYQYFLYHSALFWYALHLVLTKQVTFGLKEYIRNLKYLAITTVTLLYLNSALSVYGVNYCYLREPPLDGLPILNLNHGWKIYFLTMVLVGIISVTIVHLPSIIKEIINKSKPLSVSNICPVCGKTTFSGLFDICPVCGWEHDKVQEDDPTFKGGANRQSLIEAKADYEKRGKYNE